MNTKTFLRFLPAVLTLSALSAAVANPFTEWLDAHDVPLEHRGMNDSASGDGVPNIVKYALGLNPLEPAAPSELPLTRLVDIDGEQRLRMEIERAPDAPDATFFIEASSDLRNWSSDDVVIQENGTSIVADDTVGTDDSGRRFLRFRVAPPFDGYVYVIGGRVLGDGEQALEPNLDEERDAVVRIENVRSILVADVDTQGRSVTNWRRAGLLPTRHPHADDAEIEWVYLEGATAIHNGRLYVGPGHFVREGPTADFVTWADIDFTTGRLGDFSYSERLPSPPTNQRLGNAALVEVDGNAFYYYLGGSQDEGGQTDRIVYAGIDSETGTLGEWQVSSNPLPGADWFNRAVGVGDTIIHTSGNTRSGMWVDWIVPDTEGDITAAWNSEEYDDFYDARWDHAITTAEKNGRTFLYLIGGNTSGGPAQIDEIDFAEIIDGVPTNWTLNDEDLPEVHRRGSAAAVGDMIIVPGGASNFSFTTTRNTVFIGDVGEDGQVTWTESPTPLFQTRSYHGTAAVGFSRE